MKKNLIILCIFITLLSTEGYSQLVNVVANSPTPGICLGKDTQLNAVPSWDSGPGGEVTPVKYLWESNPPTSFFPNNSSLTVWAKPTETTQFTVTATDTKFNIVKKGIVTVIVHYPPDLKIIIPLEDSSSCINQPVEFFGKAENIKGKARWSTTGKGELKPDSDYHLHATYTPLDGETGSISITLTGDPLDYCETASDSVSRILEFVSKPGATVSPTTAGICNKPETPLALTGTASGTYTSTGWRVVPDTAGTISNPAILNPTFMPNPKFQGVATVFFDVKNKGCVASAASIVSITKFAVPLYPAKNFEMCQGEKDTLQVGFCNNCTYKWSTGATTSRITVTPLRDTLYWVEVKDYQGCVFRDTFYVTVLDSPDALCGAVNHNSKSTTVEPPGMQEYIFIVNDTIRQQGSGNIFPWGPYQEFAQEFTYIVINSDGCSVSGVCLIPPFNCVEAFTPNGDGINDLLLPGRKIVVFDRTGNILYQGFDGWDGRFNGREMPEGTYFYVSFKENNKEDCKQSVTLLRKSYNE